MKRSAIIVLLLLGLAGAGPGVSGVRAEDLTVALSSLSTETLDPVLGGHIVKFYLDQIFDYLVGVTPDGQLSADDGIATRWESSPDHKRWTFHLRRGVRFHNGDELTSDDVKWTVPPYDVSVAFPSFWIVIAKPADRPRATDLVIVWW